MIQKTRTKKPAAKTATPKPRKRSRTKTLEPAEQTRNTQEVKTPLDEAAEQSPADVPTIDVESSRFEKVMVFILFLIVAGIAFLVVASHSKPAHGAEMPIVRTQAIAAADSLLVFEGDNCPWCVKMQPAIAELASEGFSISPVNVQQRPDLAARYRIDRWPTFVFLQNGREIDRIEGATSVEQLRSRLRKPQMIDIGPQPADAVDQPRPTLPLEVDGGQWAVDSDRQSPVVEANRKCRRGQSQPDAEAAKIKALIELQERQSRTNAELAAALSAAAQQRPVEAPAPTLPRIEPPQPPLPAENASPVGAAVAIFGAVGIAAGLYYVTAKQ